MTSAAKLVTQYFKMKIRTEIPKKKRKLQCHKVQAWYTRHVFISCFVRKAKSRLVQLCPVLNTPSPHKFIWRRMFINYSSVPYWCTPPLPNYTLQWRISIYAGRATQCSKRGIPEMLPKLKKKLEGIYKNCRRVLGRVQSPIAQKYEKKMCLNCSGSSRTDIVL